MKKRILALAMAVAMSLSLVACGGGGEPQTSAPGASTPVSTDGGGEKKTLRVGMECAYAPYNWSQTDDSNSAVPIAGTNEYANGYDVWMAQRICDQLGYELEIVRSDWDGLILGVQAGTLDCAIAGQSPTPDRAEVVDFTEPYYYASVVTLTKQGSKYAEAKSVADLAGAKVTSQMNTFWYTSAVPQIPDADILAAQDSAPAMLVALDAGVCDIVVTDMPTGQAALLAYGNLVLLDFAGTDGDFKAEDTDIKISVSVQKGDTELLDGINSVLGQYTEVDFNQWMNESIAVQPLAN